MTPDEFHTVMVRTPITEEHRRLYAEFPTFRGFSVEIPTPGQFEACCVLALMETRKEARCLLLVPANHTEAVTARLSSFFQTLIRNWWGVGAPDVRRNMLQKLGKSCDRIMMGSRVLQMAEPPHWVAVGFRQEDPSPDWLKRALLPV